MNVCIFARGNIARYAPSTPDIAPEAPTAGGGVAFMAHIGGFAAGYAVGFAYKKMYNQDTTYGTRYGWRGD